MDIQGIRKARKAAKITQAELAERIGVNRATLSRYETGDIIPSLGQLGKIAKALNTNVFDMIGTDWSGIDLSDAFPPDDPVVNTPEPSLRSRLDAAFDQLNEAGRERVADIAELLAGHPDYRREKVAPATWEGTDTTQLKKPPEDGG